MSAPAGLRDFIESCELPHAAFLEHEHALLRRLKDAVAGRPPVSEWIVGPSRVGKSMLIARLLRQFPEERVNGVWAAAGFTDTLLRWIGLPLVR